MIIFIRVWITSLIKAISELSCPTALRTHRPDPQSIIGESCKEGLAISRPCDRHALGLPRLVRNLVSRFEFVYDGSG
jgi:hypothetical protein